MPTERYLSSDGDENLTYTIYINEIGLRCADCTTDMELSNFTRFPEINSTLPPNSTCPSPVQGVNDLPLALRIILGILMVLVVILCVLGNSVICLIVYQKRAMRSAINILLANMAFSNIMMSVLCMPFALVTLIVNDWILGTVMCRLVSCLHKLFSCEATMILLIISVDRYLIIVERKDKLTPTLARTLVICSWVYSAGIAFPPTVGWGLYQSYDGWMQCTLRNYQSPADLSYVVISYTLIFFVPIICMSYTYFSIVNAVRQNLLRVSSHPQAGAIHVDTPQATKLGLSVGRPPRVNVDINSKTRAFKTILLLFLVYIVCWLPYSISLMTWNLKNDLEHSYIGGSVVIFIGYMNGALNPIIYCWRIKKFREACVDILPSAVRLTPNLPRRVKRRINPGAMYETPSGLQSSSV